MVVLAESLFSWPFLLFALIVWSPTLLVLGVWGTVGFFAVRTWRQQQRDLSLVLTALFLAPVALYCYMALATEYRVAQAVKAATEHNETIVPVTDPPKVLYIYSTGNFGEEDLNYVYDVGRLIPRTAIETIVLPRRGLVYTKSADEGCRRDLMRNASSELDARVKLLLCVKKETRPSAQPDTSAVGLHLVRSAWTVKLPGTRYAHFSRIELRAKDGSSDKLLDTRLTYSFERLWPLPLPINSSFFSSSVRVPPGNSLTTVEFLLRALRNS
jgi:hypothetical protein